MLPTTWNEKESSHGIKMRLKPYRKFQQSRGFCYHVSIAVSSMFEAEGLGIRSAGGHDSCDDARDRISQEGFQAQVMALRGIRWTSLQSNCELRLYTIVCLKPIRPPAVERPVSSISNDQSNPMILR